jgi:flagellar biosynthetic protein FliR
MGKIARLLRQTESELTPLQHEVAGVGRALGRAVIVIALVVVVAILLTADIAHPSELVDVLLIGVSLGFAVRLVFGAVELAGELIGLQMGLNFAGFFDPMTASQGTASGRFFGTMVAWLFIVINGHLTVIAAVIQSFQVFPASPEPFAFLRAAQPQAWGVEVFRLGTWIALPLVAMLLFVNLVLGVISRVASQYP